MGLCTRSRWRRGLPDAPLAVWSTALSASLSELGGSRGGGRKSIPNERKKVMCYLAISRPERTRLSLPVSLLSLSLSSRSRRFFSTPAPSPPPLAHQTRAHTRAAAAMSSFAAANAGGGSDQTSAAEKEGQRAALDSVLSVLLSAGYFRARVGALTPFDKVCGIRPAGGESGPRSGKIRPPSPQKG
jgi:hypothetical protein